MNSQDKEQEKDKIKYLTEEEKKMPKDLMLLQISLGLQSCKTKGDVVDLLNEVYDISKQNERNEIIKEVEKMIDEYFMEIEQHIYTTYKEDINLIKTELKTKLQELKNGK